MNTYATTVKRDIQIALLFGLGENIASQLARLEEEDQSSPRIFALKSDVE